MNTNKVAMITAVAGSGIGAAIARQLAEDGMDIVVTDAHERRCKEYAEKWSEEFGRKFLALPLDVTDYDAVGEAINTAVESYGRLEQYRAGFGDDPRDLAAQHQR